MHLCTFKRSILLSSFFFSPLLSLLQHAWTQKPLTNRCIHTGRERKWKRERETESERERETVRQRVRQRESERDVYNSRLSTSIYLSIFFPSFFLNLSLLLPLIFFFSFTLLPFLSRIAFSYAVFETTPLTYP